MKTRWFQHIKGRKEQESYKQTLKGCNVAFMRLMELLVEDEQALIRQIADPDYQEPSWSEHQADLVGQLRTVRRLKDLINLEEK